MGRTRSGVRTQLLGLGTVETLPSMSPLPDRVPTSLPCGELKNQNSKGQQACPAVGSLQAVLQISLRDMAVGWPQSWLGSLRSDTWLWTGPQMPLTAQSPSPDSFLSGPLCLLLFNLPPGVHFVVPWSLFLSCFSMTASLSLFACLLSPSLPAEEFAQLLRCVPGVRCFLRPSSGTGSSVFHSVSRFHS